LADFGVNCIQAELRRNLRAALGELPAPSNEYEIVVPDLPTEEKDEGDEMEMDMADALTLKRKEAAAAELALWRKQTKVLQRALPRPPPAALQALKNSLPFDEDGKAPHVTLIEQADASIRQEMVALLENDAVKYPIIEEASGKEKKKGSASSARPQIAASPLDDIEEEDLQNVRLQFMHILSFSLCVTKS
jgi:pre-mRNA-splicing factor CDC5/CEF1